MNGLLAGALAMAGLAAAYLAVFSFWLWFERWFDRRWPGASKKEGRPNQ